MANFLHRNYYTQSNDEKNEVLELILSRIVCPHNWSMVFSRSCGYSGSLVIEVGLSNNVEYHSEVKKGGYNNEYISVPLFEIQSNPIIHMFQVKVPMNWDKVEVYVSSSKHSRAALRCVVGCDGDRLIFSCVGEYIEYCLGDPSFDIGVVCDKINGLVSVTWMAGPMV